MSQELAVHQFGAGLALDHQDSLYDVVVCEKSENWGLLIHVPHYHALVIGPRDKALPVSRDRKAADPRLMPRKGLPAVSSTRLPQPDRLVSRAGEDEVSFWREADIGDVVVVPLEGADAEVVIGGIPQLYREVG
jgi:hypothetical protein